MRALVIGFSSIVARRGLPALVKLPAMEAIDIASRRSLKPGSLPKSWVGDIYDDYQSALEKSEAELVYVSLVNSLHETWVEKALEAGRHVIVDKPAFLSLAATERLLDLAAGKNVCLAEAVVFPHHPQVDTLRQITSEAGGATRLVAMFSIPPLPQHNFRNHFELGGGSLYDLGPYAAATSRTIFNDPPKAIVCRVVSRHPETKVDTAFSILATYGDGRSYVGQFGFDTEYQNWLTAVGSGIAVTVNRIFTTLPDTEYQLTVLRHNDRSTVVTPAGNSFERFFSRVIESIRRERWSSLAQDLLQDAQMLNDMRTAALADTQR